MTIVELGFILLFVLGMVASAFALDASFDWLLRYWSRPRPPKKEQK